MIERSQSLEIEVPTDSLSMAGVDIKDKLIESSLEEYLLYMKSKYHKRYANLIKSKDE